MMLKCSHYNNQRKLNGRLEKTTSKNELKEKYIMGTFSYNIFKILFCHFLNFNKTLYNR